MAEDKGEQLSGVAMEFEQLSAGIDRPPLSSMAILSPDGASNFLAKLQVSSPYLSNGETFNRLSEEFPGVAFEGHYLSEGIDTVTVTGVDGHEVAYFFRDKDGRVMCVADREVPRVSAREVLATYPRSEVTFRQINEFAREALFGPAEGMVEDRWKLDFVGRNVWKTRYRMMIGRESGQHLTAVRCYGDSASKRTMGQTVFYSALQILDDQRGTLAVIDYPIAYRTVASVAVIMERLLGSDMSYTLGVLGVGGTAKNLFYAIAALDHLPDQIKVKARGTNGYATLQERLRVELGDLPVKIQERIVAAESDEDVLDVTVVCDLAHGFHPLEVRPEQLRLFFDLARSGGVRMGFDFKDWHFFDAYGGRDVNQFFKTTFSPAAGRPLMHVRSAPIGLLADGRSTATCTVSGSPVIDLKIGQEILKRRGLI
ncbi:MAG: hypothetical protein UW73_C0006G0005 [Microgenomates group bacterium GW2011_GWB1_44_8]|nr:MAG: hypothetical protein UW73_C0006G0005 [Microgenomates group bacterium GW2011_GWB1_44_8]